MIDNRKIDALMFLVMEATHRKDPAFSRKVAESIIKETTRAELYELGCRAGISVGITAAKELSKVIDELQENQCTSPEATPESQPEPQLQS